ncbi:MAG: SMI1/KNR4 family protein [Planctomycetaceae bacterium]
MDISQIEQSLGYELPASYRDFLIRLVPLIEQIPDPYDDGHLLYSDPHDVIHANKNTPASQLELPDDPKFIEKIILVADNEGGDWWFIFRNGHPQGIWMYDHETQQTTLQYSSFEDYYEKEKAGAEAESEW